MTRISPLALGLLLAAAMKLMDKSAATAGSMTLLDQIAFGTTVLVLLALLALIVLAVLSVLPSVLSLTNH